MQVASYLVGALLGFGGLLFLVASGHGNTLPRAIIGIVLLAGAAFMVYMGRMKAPQKQVVQKIDLSGDVHAEQMSCQACGGKLTSNNVAVKAGAVFVHCPYCGTEYQLEEEPKW